jgi:hypothetical protein
MRKHHVRIWLCSLLTFWLLPQCTAQQEFSNTTNNGTITITRYTGSGGIIAVPSTINGYQVTTIGADAFASTSVTEVFLPATITAIESRSFSACVDLINITLPESLKTIGPNAFRSCARLPSVLIPAAVTSIGTGAFQLCSQLTAIDVNPANTVYSSVDGVLLDKAQVTLIRCPAGRTNHFAIPPSVITIDVNAFLNCPLSSVSIPEGVKRINVQAFALCSSLRNVVIPNSVTNISDSAFTFNTALTNLSIGRGISTISGNAFANCTSLPRITIPANVRVLGEGAFAGCSALKVAVFEGNAPMFGSSAFPGAAQLYYLPGTTGWGSTVGGVRPLLWNPRIQQAGVFSSDEPYFAISGTSGLTVVVEAAPTLQGAWAAISTLTIQNGSGFFSDNNPDPKSRLYRLHSP